MQGRNPVKHNTDAGCRGEAAFIPPQANMSLMLSGSTLNLVRF